MEGVLKLSGFTCNKKSLQGFCVPKKLIYFLRELSFEQALATSGSGKVHCSWRLSSIKRMASFASQIGRLEGAKGCQGCVELKRTKQRFLNA